MLSHTSQITPDLVKIIYFAASNGNSALSWTELNGAQPVLKSSFGTTGLRDPFIIRSHEGDTFYLISTLR